MQLKGPVGSISELKPAGCPLFPGKDDPRLASLDGLQRQAPQLQSAADHLEEELDLLLSLDAPIKEGDLISPDQTPQNLGPEENRELAQEEKGITCMLFPHLPDSLPLLHPCYICSCLCCWQISICWCPLASISVLTPRADLSDNILLTQYIQLPKFLPAWLQY